MHTIGELIMTDHSFRSLSERLKKRPHCVELGGTVHPHVGRERDADRGSGERRKDPVQPLTNIGRGQRDRTPPGQPVTHIEPRGVFGPTYERLPRCKQGARC